MKLWLLSMMMLFVGSTALAAEPLRRVTSPPEVNSEIDIRKGVKNSDLVWNRWTSENFVVCSTNNEQAQFLNQHLESVKSWALGRWGLPDVHFSAECKLICVDDPVLFEKMFRITDTVVEIRRDAQGKITESVIFMLIDGKPSQTVPIPLTEVCLAEFGQAYRTNVRPFLSDGMSELNGSIEQIRASIERTGVRLEKNEPMYFTKGLFAMVDADRQALDPAKAELFRDSSMLFCLMIRREFGERAYHRFMKEASSDPSAAVQNVLKFADNEALDRSVKRFVGDVVREQKERTLPSSYLQIVPAD